MTSTLRYARRATTTGALALASVTLGLGSPAHAEERYTVRPGDTVSHLAARSGVSVAAIAEANALAEPSRIRVGQVLLVPSPRTATTGTPATSSSSSTYRVAAGDTVSAIAARTGSTVAAIVAANGLDSRAFIRAGQTLTVPVVAAPAPVDAPAATAAPTASYRVAAGDTVSAIAARTGSTVAAIVAANGLDSRAFIRAGQTLTVPTPAVTSVGSTFAGRSYPEAVVRAANANKATLLAADVPSREQVRAIVVATANELGVDPVLAQAIAHQESGFDQAAVSPANAIGAMQVIPSSGQWASQLVGRRLDLLDAHDNAVAGVAILRSLVSTSPDLPTAIASYYQGSASVRQNGMFADTRAYVASVQALMTRMS